MSSPYASFLKLSAYVDNVVLVANTAKTITKPAGYSSCVIIATVDSYVRRGGAAAVASGDVVDGTGSAAVPAGQARIIDLTDGPGITPLATFSIISGGTPIVSLEWFK